MSKSLPKVYISEPIDEKGLNMLKGKAEVLLAPDPSKKTALEMIQQANAAILRATTPFDKKVINEAKKLKIIARTGVGVNNVDLQAAGGRGIPVCVTPNTNHLTVAEHTLAMILALAKQIKYMDQAVREQKWEERFSPYQIEVKNKKIGLIGLGDIGIATARNCKAIGMEVIGYDPYISETDIAGEFTLTNLLEDIFLQPDFVSLHCPSTPETQHIVNEEHLQLMKRSAYLINTSRGNLVDETALVEALNERQIAGAALDVFKEEPLYGEHPLNKCPNVLLSPHVAGSTKESNERIAMMATQAVLDVLAGKKPDHICNEEFLNNQKTVYHA